MRTWVCIGVCVGALMTMRHVPVCGAEGTIPGSAESSRTGSIVGQVKSGPIPASWASVGIALLRRGALTGEDGWFKLDDLVPGQHQLKVQLIGCPSSTYDVAVTAGRTDTIRFEFECPALFCRDRANIASPGCFIPDPHARARAGQPCREHPTETLVADTVGVVYGLGVGGRPDFPNANETFMAGCVVGQAGFGEVAFCPACRRVAMEVRKARYGHE